MQRYFTPFFALPLLFLALPLAVSAQEQPLMCLEPVASLLILDTTDPTLPLPLEEILLDNTKEVILTIGDWQLSLSKLIEVAAPSEEATTTPIDPPQPESPLEPIPDPVVEPSPPQPVSGDILLNEALPNPIGSDSQEFIELFNADLQTIPLNGWKIADAVKSFALDGLEVIAGEYLLLPRSLSGLTLNNGTDTISLIDPLGNVLDTFSYDSSSEGQSYNRANDGTWYQALPSPGQVNNAEMVAPIPLAETLPPLSPPVSNSQNLTTPLPTLPSPPTPQPPLPPAPPLENTPSLDPNLSLIRLNELMANPVGSDDQEWLELYNPSSFRINLAGLVIADKVKEYTLGFNFIEAADLFLLPRSKSGISLNNSNETLTLKVANQVSDVFSYQTSQEGKSWALSAAGNWQLNDQPTPGAVNVPPTLPVLEIPSKNVANTMPPTDTQNTNSLPPADTTTLTEQTSQASPQNSETSTASQNSSPAPLRITLTQWPQISDGEQITVTGILSVEPGSFSTRKARLQDSYLNNLEIYFHQAAWPNLKSGSTVAISGEKSVTKKGGRLLVRATSDMVILKEAAFIAPALSGADLNNYLGAVAKIQGTLLEQSKYGLIIAADDREISVNMKTAGILLPTLPQGNQVEISGLIVNTSQGLEIRPRNKEDVQVLGTSTLANAGPLLTSGENATSLAEQGIVPLAPSEAEMLALSAKPSPNSFNNLIFLILGGGLTLLTYFSLFERAALIKQSKRLLAKTYELLALKSPIFQKIKARLGKLTNRRKLDTDTNDLLKSDYSVPFRDLN